MSKEPKQHKANFIERMSDKTKWIITGSLFLIAIVTVILCIASGGFSFRPGSVTANDETVVVTPTPKVEKDDAADEETYTVFVSAGNGGTSNPKGSVSVEAWTNLTVTFTAEEGYELESVKVDGQNIGAVSSYTLYSIVEDHNIVASFVKTPEPTPTPTPTPEATAAPEPDPDDDFEDENEGKKLSDLLGAIFG